MEMKPLRLIVSHLGSAPRGPVLPVVMVPRHFHCQEWTLPWEDVFGVAYLRLMSLLFSNIFCPLACYFCSHAKSRGLDLLKFEKDGEQKKLERNRGKHRMQIGF